MSAIKARLGKFANVNEFVDGYAQYFFRGGILLPTRQERAEGEAVSLHLKVADGSTVLRAEGVVKQTRLNSEGRPVGLVIRFTKLDASSKEVVDRIMHTKRNTPSSGNLQAVPLQPQGKNRLRDNTTGQHLAIQDIAAIADAIDDTFDSIFSEHALPAGGDGPMAGAEDEYLASLGDLGAVASSASAPSSADEFTLGETIKGEPESAEAEVAARPLIEPGMPARSDTPLSLIAEASGAAEQVRAVDTSETTIQRPTSTNTAAADSGEMPAVRDHELSVPPRLSLPEDDAPDEQHPAATTVQSRPAAPDDDVDVAEVFAKARAEAQSRGQTAAERAVDGGEDDALSLDFIDSTLDEPPRREGQATKDSKAILDALSSANRPAFEEPATTSTTGGAPIPQSMDGGASSTVFGMPAFDASTRAEAAGAQSLAKMELKKKAQLEEAPAPEHGERVMDFIASLTEGSGAQPAVSSTTSTSSDVVAAIAVSESTPTVESGGAATVSGSFPYAAAKLGDSTSDDFVESVADRVASASLGEEALDELIAGDEPDATDSFAPPPMHLERAEPPAGLLAQFVAWLKGLFRK